MGNGNVTLRTHAHQVIDVQPDGPAAKCGLKNLDDFIIRLDGRLLMDLSPEEMQKMVVDLENMDVDVEVYSTADQKMRTVTIRPTRKWAGKGLLGVSLRLSQFDGYQHVKDIAFVERRSSASAENESENSPVKFRDHTFQHQNPMAERYSY